MKIDPPILVEAAKKYQLKLSELHPLGGMDGMALAFERGDTSYVLKVTPGYQNNPNQGVEIAAKSRFISYLAESGLRVARPIQSPDGNWWEQIETREGIYFVTATTRAEGRHVNLHDPRQSRPSLFEAWGKITGQMHRLTKAYPHWRKDLGNGAPSSPITDWKGEHDHFTKWCQLDEIREKWVALGQEINSLPLNRECYGLIHNDLHPKNFLVDRRGTITVIDFDVCTYHFLIKDIAIALFFANWIGNPGKGRSKDNYLTLFLQHFLKGYATENDLEYFWYQQLPLFLKHHQILLFIVFTDEWKLPNKWQSDTLNNWKRLILSDAPVVNLLF